MNQPECETETALDETNGPEVAPERALDETDCPLCGGTGEVQVAKHGTGELVIVGCPQCLEDDQTPDKIEQQWRLSVFEANADVAGAEEKVLECKAEAERCKALLKAAESDFAATVAELRDAISGKGQGKLPLGPVTSPETEKEQGRDASPKQPLSDRLVGGELRVHGASDEGWREIRVGQLGLPEATVTLLKEANLPTVGDVADFVKGSPGRALTAIRGVGEAKAARIENALEHLWEERDRGTPGEPALIDDLGDGRGNE